MFMPFCKITVFTSNADNIVEFQRAKNNHYSFRRYIVNSDYSMMRLHRLFKKYHNNVTVNFDYFPISVTLYLNE